MQKRQLLISLLATAILIALSGARADDGGHDARRALPGTWAINFIVPPSPKGNLFGQPHRHKFDFRNEDGLLTVVAREIFDLRVPGAWRSSNDQFSATFEFTCPDDVDCGTIIMRGQLDSETRLSGRVAIFWDTPDATTETGYDTVTGTFTGEKCGGIRPTHDTGGCDSP